MKKNSRNCTGGSCSVALQEQQAWAESTESSESTESTESMRHLFNIQLFYVMLEVANDSISQLSQGSGSKASDYHRIVADYEGRARQPTAREVCGYVSNTGLPCNDNQQQSVDVHYSSTKQNIQNMTKSNTAPIIQPSDHINVSIAICEAVSIASDVNISAVTTRLTTWLTIAPLKRLGNWPGVWFASNLHVEDM